jgi:hypothetical protein
VVATLETNRFWIHTLLSGRQTNRTQQPTAYATVFVARTGSFASSVEPQLVAEIRADNALDQGSPTDDLVCLLHQDDEEIHGARRAVRSLRHLPVFPIDSSKGPKLGTLPR